MKREITKPAEISVEAIESTPTQIERFQGSIGHQGSNSKLRILWERRQPLLRWMGAGFILSALIALFIPSRYDSTARLMPPDDMNSSMGMLALAAGGRGGVGGGSGLGSELGSMASDLLGLKSSGDLFIGILQSQGVQDDVINKFNLRKVYWDRYIEDARKDLAKNTDLSADRKSGIVKIQVTDRSPQRAAEIAQEYVSELNRIVVTLNTSTAHREREFLEQRLDQVKQELESAENGFGQFASQNTALDIPAEGKAMIEASADLEGELIASQTELQSLRQIYADGNVRVRSLQARVDELKRQLEKLGGKYDSSGNQADQPFYPSIKKLPLLGVKYADLYRNAKVEEAVFETLTQEYEIAKVQEVKETPSVKVLDPPQVPEKKSYPPRMVIIALGTFLSASLGVVWIFGSALWNEVDPRDPNKILVLEVSQATRARLPWLGANGSGNGDHHPGKGDCS